MERVSKTNEYANARSIERGDVGKSLFLRGVQWQHHHGSAAEQESFE
jgi:hypothetical protein